MSIVVRYPGRACLLGEHCDWAGGASLAVPLHLGIEVTVEPARADLHVRSRLGDRLLEGRWPVEGLVDREGGPLRFVPAAARLLRDRGIRVPPAWLWVDADLPAGRGFSSSAAFSLALLDGLARHAGQVLPTETLAELAYVLEHDLLGVDCGRLDPLACVAGSPAFLPWHDGRAPLHRLAVGRPAHLVVAALPGRRSARRILAALHRLYHAPIARSGAASAAVHHALAAWASAAERGSRALETGDLERLGAAMDEAQEVYEELLEPLVPELAAPRLRGAVRALREAGVLGAKFSGAGGDGSVIALAADAEGARTAAARLAREGIATWTLALEET